MHYVCAKLGYHLCKIEKYEFDWMDLTWSRWPVLQSGRQSPKGDGLVKQS